MVKRKILLSFILLLLSCLLTGCFSDLGYILQRSVEYYSLPKVNPKALVFAYELNDKNEAVIIGLHGRKHDSGYEGGKFDLKIPSTVDKYKVTAVDDFAFYNCCNFLSVTIAEGVTSIGEHAFEACPSLRSVNFPDTLITIGGHAFVSCDLKSIIIPNSVTSIGWYAFSNNPNLKSATIPESVVELGFLLDDNGNKYYVDGVGIFGNYNYNKDLIVYTPKGSHVDSYAKKNNIKVEYIE